MQAINRRATATDDDNEQLNGRISRDNNHDDDDDADANDDDDDLVNVEAVNDADADDDDDNDAVAGVMIFAGNNNVCFTYV